MKNTDVPSTRDHAMILPGHKIEFFEVSSHGTPGIYTGTTGEHDDVIMLKETLSNDEQRLKRDLHAHE